MTTANTGNEPRFLNAGTTHSERMIDIARTYRVLAILADKLLTEASEIADDITRGAPEELFFVPLYADADGMGRYLVVPLQSTITTSVGKTVVDTVPVLARRRSGTNIYATLNGDAAPYLSGVEWEMARIDDALAFQRDIKSGMHPAAAIEDLLYVLLAEMEESIKDAGIDVRRI